MNGWVNRSRTQSGPGGGMNTVTRGLTERNTSAMTDSSANDRFKNTLPPMPSGVTVPDFVPGYLSHPLTKNATKGTIASRRRMASFKEAAKQLPEPEPKRRVSTGPVKMRVPLVLDGELTDFGYGLRAIARLNEENGDGADLPNRDLAIESGLTYQRSTTVLTALYRGGLVDMVRSDDERALPLTEKGQDACDSVFHPEGDSYFTAVILRPTNDVAMAIRKELDKDPEVSVNDLVKAAKVKFAMVTAALVYLDDQTEVAR